MQEMGSIGEVRCSRILFRLRCHPLLAETKVRNKNQECAINKFGWLLTFNPSALKGEGHKGRGDEQLLFEQLLFINPAHRVFDVWLAHF